MMLEQQKLYGRNCLESEFAKLEKIRKRLSGKKSLSELAEWYSSNCNGEWEHSFGVVITSLDNPGWHLKIDLVGTKLEKTHFDVIELLENEHDWLSCDVKNGVFNAICGPNTLNEAIGIFLEWAKC